MPDSTKPLPKPMLTYNQRYLLTFSWRNFTETVPDITRSRVFENHILKIVLHLTGVNELRHLGHVGSISHHVIWQKLEWQDKHWCTCCMKLIVVYDKLMTRNWDIYSSCLKIKFKLWWNTKPFLQRCIWKYYICKLSANLFRGEAINAFNHICIT